MMCLGVCRCCDGDLSIGGGLFSPDVRGAAVQGLDSCSLLLLHVPSPCFAGAIVHFVSYESSAMLFIKY